jgi:hypothetical protein
MALAKTTLSSAVTASDIQIVVASATSVAAGRLIQINQETMKVAASYVSGTTVPVLRGISGSKTSAHVSKSQVVHGLPSDFAEAAAGGPSVVYQAQRATVVESVGATSTLTLAPAGTDHRVILRGTSVITLTIPVPTKDKDGDMLLIVSDGAAAHVPTFTGGVGGAGSNYDAFTYNATGALMLMVVAANETWQMVAAPAITGTVTNITAGVA